MKLNKVPYPKKAYRQQVLQFGGINYGMDAVAGELEESLNLSSREAPCLCQREGMRKAEEFEAADAVYEWDGKTVICRGGKLFYDGRFMADVLPGSKQFAALGAQLAVWPDEIVLNMRQGLVTATNGSFTTANDWSTQLTDTSLTAPANVLVHGYAYDSGYEQLYIGVNDAETKRPAVYCTYGTDPDAVRACWNKDLGAWDKDALKRLEEYRYAKGADATAFPDHFREIANGEILVHGSTSNYAFSAANGKINTDGTVELPSDDRLTDGVMVIYEYMPTSDLEFGAVVCYASMSNPHFAGRFSVGDRVDIEGGPFGILGGHAVQITEIDGEKNILKFEEGTLRDVVLCAEKAYEEPLYPWKTYYFVSEYENDNGTSALYRSFKPETILPAGLVLFSTSWQAGSTTDVVAEAVLLDPVERTVYGPYDTTVETESANENVYNMRLKTYTTILTYDNCVSEIKVRRSIPKLDLICAHNNRLVGADNTKRCVWVSAQGKPLEFYEDPTLASGAWSAAVGSDGDFTGICSYGGNALLWKEDRLHKLLGETPADFALYEYEVSGVQKGSERSLVGINETLLYKSGEGVCAYAGSTPRLISSSFGLQTFRNAAAGTDGKRYYISMQRDEDGGWEAWVYDPAAGTWMLERRERDLDYMELGGRFCILKEDGTLWERGGAFEKDGEWCASFCEMTESYHGRKSYSRLLLRYTLGEGATIRGSISVDGGAFCELAFRKNEGTFGTAVLPIGPVRCDKLRIRLSGTGYCRIESMVRKFRIGGEW